VRSIPTWPGPGVEIVPAAEKRFAFNPNVEEREAPV
jgi:hypothetical protein